ncbi:hypothetical protein CDIK_0236 [Cucumispora dikerogammari]|nr:hypothetical protein CDIK_0236 [Cucumispora dikerogammari]
MRDFKKKYEIVLYFIAQLDVATIKTIFSLYIRLESHDVTAVCRFYFYELFLIHFKFEQLHYKPLFIFHRPQSFLIENCKYHRPGILSKSFLKKSGLSIKHRVK